MNILKRIITKKDYKNICDSNKDKFYISKHFNIDRQNYRKYSLELNTKFLDEFFWKAFQMLRVNRINGDYLEFGSGFLVRSFRLAYKYKVLENMKLKMFAFDSFKGLPKLEGIDDHVQWSEGDMAVSIEEFHIIMKHQNIQREDYTIVPGFYNESLNGFTPKDYGITKAAMIFIDCDLYSSTKSVLNFVEKILVKGCIIAFDDWFCFDGDPFKGEQKAFSEFLNKNKGVSVSEYLRFGWHGMSFIVNQTV